MEVLPKPQLEQDRPWFMRAQFWSARSHLYITYVYCLKGIIVIYWSMLHNKCAVSFIQCTTGPDLNCYLNYLSIDVSIFSYCPGNNLFIFSHVHQMLVHIISAFVLVILFRHVYLDMGPKLSVFIYKIYHITKSMPN